MASERRGPIIGLLAADGSTNGPLARAAAIQRVLPLRLIGRDEPLVAEVAGLIVDAPLEERAALVAHLAPVWRVPILIESPVAADVEQAQSVAGLADAAAVVSANPLRYGLHTRRLVEQVGARDDPLHTFFAAWRFRSSSVPEAALPQLLDLLRALSPGALWRVSMLARSDPALLVGTLRYASGVIGSLEVGCHLAESFAAPSELVIECACAARMYHCAPGQQAVSVYGAPQRLVDWQPGAAESMVAAFVDWLQGGPRPIGRLQDDLAALTDSQWIRRAAQTDEVLVTSRR